MAIPQIIIDNSQVLRELTTDELIPVELTEKQSNIIINYLSSDSPVVNGDVFQQDILQLIDYLLLPTERLLNNYRVTGEHLELLEEYRLVPPYIKFTLFNIDKSEWCHTAAQHGN